MASGSVECELTASADAAWDAVGDFAGVDKIFPDLESLEIEGDDRILGMFGMKIRERLIERDDAQRRLVYSIVDGVPIDSHSGTITVEAVGEGSKVTWAYEVTPDEMADILGGTYGGALEQLKKYLGEA
ncbi:MAG: SRPBCC family protein [Actinomycetes bacterium]